MIIYQAWAFVKYLGGIIISARRYSAVAFLPYKFHPLQHPTIPTPIPTRWSSIHLSIPSDFCQQRSYYRLRPKLHLLQMCREQLFYLEAVTKSGIFFVTVIQVSKQAEYYIWLNPLTGVCWLEVEHCSTFVKYANMWIWRHQCRHQYPVKLVSPTSLRGRFITRHADGT